MSQESFISQFDQSSSPFIFEELEESSFRKSELMKPILASTKPSANQYLPVPNGYQFKPCRLPKKFEMFADHYRNFKVRKDDVWVLSFPKAGTTWIQNIVWQLMNGLDFTKRPFAFNDTLFLEWNMHNDYSGEMEGLSNEPSPRIIKSHLPASLLPIELWTVRPKMIYIARNPKDAAVSMYHMLNNIFTYFAGTLDEFLELFLQDRVWYGPYCAHVIDFWQLRHLDNLLFLTYEELSTNRFDGVKRISEFLECKYSDDDLMELTKYVSFDNMKKMTMEQLPNASDSKVRFFRKGKSGGFNDEMSQEFIEKFDRWMTESCQNSDFIFTN